MGRKSQSQVLEALVASGRMSAAEADEILAAPRISFAVRELLYYLAALIVTVGVVRLVIVIFSDASSSAIVAALYLAALVIGFGAYKLNAKDGWRGRLSEILEVLATLCAALATGVLLRQNLDHSGEVSAMWPAGVAAVWGLIRLRKTDFSSAAIVVPSAYVLAGTTAALIDASGQKGTLPVMVAAGFLVLIGTQKVGADFVYRIAGAVALLGTSPGWVADKGSFSGLVVTLGIGVALFALGATFMWVELLGTGAIIITIAIATYVFQNVDNEVMQGVIVVAMGLAILAATSMTYRRIHQARSNA